MTERETDFVNVVLQRLQTEKFEIQRQVKISSFSVDLLAYCAYLGLKLNYRAICSISLFSRLTENLVRDYSQAIYEFGASYKPFRSSTCLVFPVSVSDSVDEHAKSFVRSFAGKHFVVGMLTTYVEHPVIVEMTSGEMFHYEHSGIVAALPEKAAIDFANKHFSPSHAGSGRGPST